MHAKNDSMLLHRWQGQLLRPVYVGLPIWLYVGSDLEPPCILFRLIYTSPGSILRPRSSLCILSTCCRWKILILSTNRTILSSINLLRLMQAATMIHFVFRNTLKRSPVLNGRQPYSNIQFPCCGVSVRGYKRAYAIWARDCRRTGNCTVFQMSFL